MTSSSSQRPSYQLLQFLPCPLLPTYQVLLSLAGEAMAWNFHEWWKYPNWCGTWSHKALFMPDFKAIRWTFLLFMTDGSYFAQNPPPFIANISQCGILGEMSLDFGIRFSSYELKGSCLVEKLYKAFQSHKKFSNLMRDEPKTVDS